MMTEASHAYLLNYLSFEFLIGIFCVLAFVLTKNFRLNFYHGFLLASFITVSITALLITRGRSIFWLPIIALGTHLVYSFRVRSDLKPSNFKWLDVLSMIFFSSAFYITNFILHGNLNLFPFFKIRRDDLFYSEISAFIKRTGEESYYTNWETFSNEANIGIQTYHFIEPYFTILAGQINQQLAAFNYSFFVYPFACILSYTSLQWLYSQFRGNYNFLISLLFGALIYTFYPVKLLVITPGLAFLMFGIYRKDYIILALASSFLLVSSPFFQVFICVFVVAFIVAQFLFKSDSFSHFKFSINLIWPLAFYLILNFAFKSDLGTVSKVGLDGNWLVNYYSDFGAVKLAVDYFLEYLYYPITMHWPILVVCAVLVIVSFRKMNPTSKQILFTLFSIWVIAGAVSAGIHFLADSSQLSTVVSSCVIFILIIVLFCFEKRRLLLVALLALFYMKPVVLNHIKQNNINSKEIGFRHSRYAQNYLNKIESEVKTDPNTTNILRLFETEGFSSPYGILESNHFPGKFLAFLKNDYRLYTFNNKDIPKQESFMDFFNINRERVLPVCYTHQYFQEFSDLNDEEKVKQFITDHKIDFLITVGDAFPAINLKKFTTKVIADTKSNEKFYVVDTKFH